MKRKKHRNDGQRKRGKGAGYEYWTPRPGNFGGGVPGRAKKRQTHRAERRQGKETET